uniref:Uncharacterized protein n=2 Tax=Schistocephalus solidus TaxID=70667 RepID=A0A0V0JBK2_SCHSO
MARREELDELMFNMQTGLNQLVALSDDAEKVVTFHRTLLLWEIKADHLRTAFSFAKSIVWKTIEKDFYLYVYSQLSYWLRITYEKEDKENVKLKLKNVIRRLKSLINSCVGLDLPSILPQYRVFLRELEGCENGLDSMTLEKATIEAEALQLLEQTSLECGQNMRVYERLNEISQASSFDKSLDRLDSSQAGFQSPLRSVASTNSLVPTEPPLEATSRPSVPRTIPHGETSSQIIRTSISPLATAVTTEEASKNVPKSRNYAVTRLAGPVGPHSSQPYSPRSSATGFYGSAARSPSAPNSQPAASTAAPQPVATTTALLDTSRQSSLYTNLMKPSAPSSMPTAPTSITSTMPTIDLTKPSSAEDNSNMAYVTISKPREVMSSQTRLPTSEAPLQSAATPDQKDTRPFGYRANAAYFQTHELGTRQAVIVPPPAHPVGFENYGQRLCQSNSSARMPTIERIPSTSDQPTTQQPAVTISQPPSGRTFTDEGLKPDPFGEHIYTNSFAFEMVPVTHPAALQTEETNQPPATTMMPSLPPRSPVELTGPRMTLRDWGMRPTMPEGQPALPEAREPAAADTQHTSRPLDLPVLASPTSFTSGCSFTTTPESTRFFQQVEEKARQMADQPRIPEESIKEVAQKAEENSNRPSGTNSVVGEGESSVQNMPDIIDGKSISTDTPEDNSRNVPSRRLPIRREQMEIEMSSPESLEENEKLTKGNAIIARSSDKASTTMNRKGFQRSRSQTKPQKLGHPGRHDSYTWEQNNETIRMVSGTSPISVALFTPEESEASSPVDQHEQRLWTAKEAYSRSQYARTERRVNRQLEQQQRNDYRGISTDSDSTLDYKRQEKKFSPVQRQRRSASQSPQRNPAFKVVMKGPATQVSPNLNGTSDSSSTLTEEDRKLRPLKLKVEPLIYESHHKRSCLKKQYGSTHNVAHENVYACHLNCRKSRSPSPRLKQMESCQKVPVQCARLIAECVPLQQNIENTENSVLLHHVCKRCQHELDRGACLEKLPSLDRLSLQACQCVPKCQLDQLETCSPVRFACRSRSRRRHKHYLSDTCSTKDSEEYIGSREIYANRAFMKCYQGNARALSRGRACDNSAPIYAVRSFMDIRS